MHWSAHLCATAASSSFQTSFLMLLAAGWFDSSPLATLLLSSLCLSSMTCLPSSVNSLAVVLAAHSVDAASHLHIVWSSLTAQKSLAEGMTAEPPLELPPSEPPADPDSSGALFTVFVTNTCGTSWKTAVSGSGTAIRAEPELITVTEIFCGFKEGRGDSPEPSTLQTSCVAVAEDTVHL